MKIGLFYEDSKTGELFMANNFTRSAYHWIDSKGNNIREDKGDAQEHINGWACNDKKKIKNFLENLDYSVRGLCYTCDKTYVSKFTKYKNESACGDDLCPVCGDKLRY